MEPGRSNKAQMASLSHTGSLTPNYKILQIAFKNAGASFLLFVFPLTLFAAFVEAFATPLFIKAFLN